MTCTTHHHACDCQESAHKEEIEKLQQQVADMEKRKDAAYFERNQVVAALAKCFPSGIAKTAIDGWSEDWHGCVYIDLPTGQVSWHYHDSQAYLFNALPEYQGVWDGHSTDEKYARLNALTATESTAEAHDQRIRDEVLEKAAKCCEAIAEERFRANGTYEDDTGAGYYSGVLEDEYQTRDEEDDVCAAAIRSMKGEKK